MWLTNQLIDRPNMLVWVCYWLKTTCTRKWHICICHSYWYLSTTEMNTLTLTCWDSQSDLVLHGLCYDLLRLASVVCMQSIWTFTCSQLKLAWLVLFQPITYRIVCVQHINDSYVWYHKEQQKMTWPRDPQALVPLLQFGCYDRNEMTMMVSTSCQVGISACTCI